MGCFGKILCVGLIALGTALCGGEEASFPLPKTATGLGLLTSHQSETVRAAAVAALREKGAQEVDRFFDDPVQKIREAAVCAAYDENIEAALPQLADRAHLIARSIGRDEDPLIAKRAIRAAWLVGRAKDLALVAQIVGDRTVHLRPRVDALRVLLDWEDCLVEKGQEGDELAEKEPTMIGDRVAVTAKNLGDVWRLFETLPTEPVATQIILFDGLVKLAQAMNYHPSKEALRPLLEAEYLPLTVRERAELLVARE